MLDFIIWLFVGCPGILVSVILSVIGLLKNKYRLMVVSAILALPFSWFLSGFPAIRSPVILTPLFVFGSAWAVRHGRPMLAWLLAIPFFLVVVLLFEVVQAQ